MGEYETGQAQILDGASGLHDTYFVRQKTFWRGASYAPAQPQNDYASRMQRIAGGGGGGMKSGGLEYSLGKTKEGSFLNQSSIYSSTTASKPLCCGRRNAGPHLQCASCPRR